MVEREADQGQRVRLRSVDVVVWFCQGAEFAVEVEKEGLRVETGEVDVSVWCL